MQLYGVLIDYLSVSIKSVFEALRIDCRAWRISTGLTSKINVDYFCVGAKVTTSKRNNKPKG